MVREHIVITDIIIIRIIGSQYKKKKKKKIYTLHYSSLVLVLMSRGAPWGTGLHYPAACYTFRCMYYTTHYWNTTLRGIILLNPVISPSPHIYPTS